MFRLSLLPFVLLLTAGCDRAPSGGRSSAVKAEVATYEAKGVLKEITAGGRKAVIAHEAIPDYMVAMTMEFEAADAQELAGLRPGDVLAFRLSVTETHGWIDRVRKTGESVVPVSASPPPSAVEAGTLLPDCELVDQRGQPFRLADFKGRALAFTFIFTRCPFPDFCPRMNNQLSAAQLEIAAAKAGANWHLLSISLDPEYDTPARLAEYAARYQPDAAHWTFATGRSEDILKLGSTVGLVVSREGGQINHNLRTVVVDAAGRVQKIFAGNEWTAADLAAEMQRAMAAKP